MRRKKTRRTAQRFFLEDPSSYHHKKTSCREAVLEKEAELSSERSAFFIYQKKGIKKMELNMKPNYDSLMAAYTEQMQASRKSSASKRSMRMKTTELTKEDIDIIKDGICFCMVFIPWIFLGPALLDFIAYIVL